MLDEDVHCPDALVFVTLLCPFFQIRRNPWFSLHPGDLESVICNIALFSWYDYLQIQAQQESERPAVFGAAALAVCVEAMQQSMRMSTLHRMPGWFVGRIGLLSCCAAIANLRVQVKAGGQSLLGPVGHGPPSEIQEWLLGTVAMPATTCIDRLTDHHGHQWFRLHRSVCSPRAIANLEVEVKVVGVPFLDPKFIVHQVKCDRVHKGSLAPSPATIAPGGKAQNIKGLSDSGSESLSCINFA